MISTLEKEITFRYLKTRKKDGFLNIISIFSFIGISLGVAVLIIVMSVMNGFRTELINKIVGFNAHVTVKPYDTPINIEKLNNTTLKLISNDLIFSNIGEAIVINKDYTKGIVLRGYNNQDFSKLDIVKKGNLKNASTRGDGYQGENVTKNVLTIKEIPSKLKGSNILDEIEVRGEIFLTRENFIKLNDKLNDKEKFANPRNAAAGSLRQIDPKITKRI